MSYRVWCSVCGLTTTFESLEEVWELYEAHLDEHGDHHVVEFEKIH